MRFVPGYTKDDPIKRRRAKSSRLLLGTAPSYPVACDWSSKEGPQEDQGQTGSCGGHGTSQGLMVAAAVQGILLGFVPSPAGIYTVTRCLERVPGTPLTDSGVMPADIFNAIALWGVRPLGLGYFDGRLSDVSQENVNLEPDLNELETDATHLIVGSYRIDETQGDVLMQAYGAIAKLGAIGVGIFVDTQFQQWQPSMGPLNDVDLADPNGGGHWTTIDGYDSAAGTFTILNSWGSSWGRNGHIDVTANWFKQAVTDVYAYDIKVTQ